MALTLCEYACKSVCDVKSGIDPDPGEGHGSIPDLTSQTDLHAYSQRVNAM